MQLCGTFTGRDFVSNETGTTVHKTFYLHPDAWETEWDVLTFPGLPSIGDNYDYTPASGYTGNAAAISAYASSFICTDITNMGKLAEDEEDISASASFMWVVQATYTRSNSRGAHVSYNEHGEEIIEEDPSVETLPWKKPVQITEQPYELQVTDIGEVYNLSGFEFTLANKAGTPIPVTSPRYGRKITVEYDTLTSKHCGQAYINSDDFFLNGFYYPARTILMQPFYAQTMLWTNNKRQPADILPHQDRPAIQPEYLGGEAVECRRQGILRRDIHRSADAAAGCAKNWTSPDISLHACETEWAADKHALLRLHIPRRHMQDRAEI